ncbi:NmrA-like protein [Ilyonectria robusta]
MLILIASITGIVGQECARAAFRAGYQVHSLARKPNKLSKFFSEQLETFVKMKDIYEIPALDEAVKDVDAIISAVRFTSLSIVDGKILLLRAAERAGMKIFHAASWNYDWTRVQLGNCESYDSYIVFHNHIRLSSSIKPIYGFTGPIVDFLFHHASHRNLVHANAKTLSFYGLVTKHGLSPSGRTSPLTPSKQRQNPTRPMAAFITSTASDALHAS